MSDVVVTFVTLTHLRKKCERPEFAPAFDVAGSSPHRWYLPGCDANETIAALKAAGFQLLGDNLGEAIKAREDRLAD